MSPREQKKRAYERQKQETMPWREEMDACDDQESLEEHRLRDGIQNHHSKVNHPQGWIALRAQECVLLHQTLASFWESSNHLRLQSKKELIEVKFITLPFAGVLGGVLFVAPPPSLSSSSSSESDSLDDEGLACSISPNKALRNNFRAAATCACVQSEFMNGA